MLQPHLGKSPNIHSSARRRSVLGIRDCTRVVVCRRSGADTIAVSLGWMYHCRHSLPTRGFSRVRGRKRVSNESVKSCVRVSGSSSARARYRPTRYSRQLVAAPHAGPPSCRWAHLFSPLAALCMYTLYEEYYEADWPSILLVATHSACCTVTQTLNLVLNGRAIRLWLQGYGRRHEIQASEDLYAGHRSNALRSLERSCQNLYLDLMDSLISQSLSKFINRMILVDYLRPFPRLDTRAYNEAMNATQPI